MWHCRVSLVIAAVLATHASGHFANSSAGGDSTLEIISKLKSFRDGVVVILDEVATTMDKNGSSTDAQKVRQFNDDWLSILGVRKGITGLAKDYVLNYMGRSKYHSSNGELVESIKKVSAAIPEKKSASLTEAESLSIRRRLLDVCTAGKKLYENGGSLHAMLGELEVILHMETSIPAFAKSDRAQAEIHALKSLFEYTATRPPADEL
mmetsp:Transcript_41968/g.83026  ORF Transcript_41968/g.83026 Transcript_41968/m.83026 type:complete len:208 (-) Transcript_41968:222-845(-)